MRKISDLTQQVEVDPRTLAWRLQGLGHFIKHATPDACVDQRALYGIGDLVEQCGLQLELLTDELESQNKEGHR